MGIKWLVMTITLEYDVTTFSLPIEDGTIVGHAYKPKNNDITNKTIIISHGFAETSAMFDHYARRFASTGYYTVTFDFRGGSLEGKSTGLKSTEMSIFTEIADLKTVINFVQKQESSSRSDLYLMGDSQGGLVSAIVGDNFTKQLGGLILLYPALVIPDDARKRYHSLAEIPDTVDLGIPIGKVYYEKLLDYEVFDHVGHFGKSVLILHGDQDEVVPLSYSKRVAKVYSHAKLIVMKDAKHGFNEIESRIAGDYILEFLNKDEILN